jgi:cell division initiation protein
MEVTPKVLRDVQFREKMRGGYHPEDVDEFLEQAAVGVEELLGSLRDATERADRAEQLATEASANDDALKRMLLMGQRTVDQAIKEAREEAHRLVADARVQAAADVAEAEERGRRAYEGSLAETRVKMEVAATALRQAQKEQETLQKWVTVNKSQLLAALHDAQGLIEDAALQGEPPPSSALDAVNQETALPDSGEAEAEDPIEPHLRDPNLREPNLRDKPSTENGSESPARQTERAPTGEWDARLLDDVAVQAAPTNGDEPSETGAERAVLAVAGVPATDEMGPVSRASSDEATVAFDERALDSFFSDQDIADDRSLGRFRRRP